MRTTSKSGKDSKLKPICVSIDIGFGPQNDIPGFALIGVAWFLLAACFAICQSSSNETEVSSRLANPTTEGIADLALLNHFA